jgi:uncharacterized protein
MHYFVVLTTECDLRCRYCYGGNMDDLESADDLDSGQKFDDIKDVPAEISYSVSDLKKFIDKDDDPTIILYGGEPLLRIDLVKEIMDQIPARYMLQTNGIHLRDLGEKYVLQLENVMFSIDGDRETTDFYRGEGVYDKVIENLNWLVSIGFKGEKLARMTVQEQTDICKQVKHLLSLPFDSVHWQLNANFWSSDLKNREFSKWADEEYNPGISKLVEFWINNIKGGEVIRIYPFVGIMQSLLKEEKSLLRCGAGWAQYAVLTNGKIAPCPVMAGMRRYYVGNLKSDPNDLKKVRIDGPCNSCDIKDLCGGRCLFANKTRLWGDKEFENVCETVSHLISELQRIEPEVQKLIGSGKIKISDFDYPKFNSCEIIP